MPDLASTLTTQAEQEAEDANVSFLRGELADDGEEADPHPRGGDWRDRTSTELRAELAHYNPDLNEYRHRPRTGVEDYHGWAPGSVEVVQTSFNDPPASSTREENSVRRESQDLRERMRNRLRRDYFHDRVAELSARLSDSRRSSPVQEPPQSSQQPVESTSGADSSLRTTALLQAVRRNSQFSAHSRNQLQRYILERERMGSEPEDRRESSTSSRQVDARHLSPSQRQQHELREARVRAEILMQQELLSEHQRRLEQLAEENWLRNRPSTTDVQPESRRRRYYHVASSRPAADVRSVDNTIKYLGRLKFCESDSEGLETAEEIGFDCNERTQPDFLREANLVPPPPESSWLKVGGVLSGSQSAVTPSVTNVNPSTAQQTYIPALPSSQPRSRIRHPTFGTTHARTTSPVRSSNFTTSLSSNRGESAIARPTNNPEAPTGNSSSNDEHWPVKVTIQAIDYQNMSLAGTMEAFNVPDKSSPTRESSITTYLEGEIIDFNTHTLETKSFKADTRTDATYWSRLPPFRDLKDEEQVIRCLTSERWLREELMEKWILMRWKGSSSLRTRHPLLYQHELSS